MEGEPGLCRYRDALGRPGEGPHAPRLFGLAAADLLLTGAAAALIVAAGRRREKSTLALLVAFFVAFLALVLLGVGAHALFCVDTALNRRLGIAGSGPEKDQA